MSNYVFIFRGGRDPNITPAALGAHLEKWRLWITDLTTNGHVAAPGAALADEGKTLRGKEKTLTDGPYAEAKDLVTGSIVIQAPTLEAALALARGCPIFDYAGSVEVRPTLPPLQPPQ